jgi:hypothetical protein
MILGELRISVDRIEAYDSSSTTLQVSVRLQLEQANLGEI